MVVHEATGLTVPAGPAGSGGPVACDLLITGGMVMGASEGSAVAVASDTILAVGPEAELRAGYAPARRVDASGCVVAPGFVDAHVHLGAHLGAGRPYAPATGPGPFSGAGAGAGTATVLPMVARFCAMDLPAEVTAPIVRAVLAAMLRSGVTGVVDAGGPGVEGVWQAAADIGIRAALGPSVADQWHDDTGRLVRQADADEALARAEAFVARGDGPGGRVRPLASAVETMACSDELLAGLAALAAVYDLPSHVHSHISAEDVREHEQAFGCGPTERLARAGLLTERCTVMHAGSLSDDDVRAFAAAGVTVNHNPTGNALHGFGVTAGRTVPRLLEAGVPVVLGSDFAPTVADPFEMVRAALMLQRDLAARDDALTLEQALTMATAGAAPLGRPGRLGRVEAGALADLVLVDVTGPHHLDSTHPVPALALHARAGDVRSVFVAGEPVVEDGRLAALDEPALVASARAALRAGASRR